MACSLWRVGQPRAVAAPSFLFLNANGILWWPVSSAAVDACIRGWWRMPTAELFALFARYSRIFARFARLTNAHLYV